MTEKEKIKLKLLLRDKAIEFLHNRIEHADTAMKQAQAAANEVEKSSVGDKYETSRSMAQMDRDIHARQRESANKELAFIQHIDVSLFHKHVELGSYVETDSEKYFFLAGLGAMEVQSEKIYFLSVNSPVGKAFAGKAIGDEVVFNGKKFLIRQLF